MIKQFEAMGSRIHGNQNYENEGASTVDVQKSYSMAD